MYIMLTKISSQFKSFRFIAFALIAGSLSTSIWAQIASSAALDATSGPLLAKHDSLASALASNVYGRPLVLDSAEAGDFVSGNAYAVLDTSFATVSTAFRNANTWCDVMILHINTKGCRVIPGSKPATLKVNIGKKTPQSLQDSPSLEFVMRQVSASPSLLVVQLNAENGPLGTSNYRIELQAAPIEGNKTFMHLRYAYQYGTAGRLAMQGYLATGGRGKVGFSTKTPTTVNAKPMYIGGARGAVERNTMRYYLAIDAYLQSLSLPPASQVNARLDKWFDATEQYPQQLRETDKASYVSMKKNEIQRQLSGTP